MTSALASLTLLALTLGPQAGTLANRISLEEARKHYQSGEKLVSEEAFEAAAREFRTATELDPDYVLAHYSLGQVLMTLRRYPDAVTSFTAARDTLLRQSTLDQKARADLDRRRRDEIAELQDSLQRLESGKIKAASSADQIRIEQRLSLLRDSAQRGTENILRVPAELSLALGSAHFRLGHLEDAEREYRAATAEDSKLGAAHNNLAVICMLTGRFDEARKEIKAAEKAGFTVSEQFKRDLKEKEKAAKSSAQ